MRVSNTNRPRQKSVQVLCPAGLHRMAYVEWGDPLNPQLLICVHGLTRTGRDFDTLASQLCQEYRLICPDVMGRGQSDWLRDANYYEVPQYVADMVTLIAAVSAPYEEAGVTPTIDWLGTSMGGLIGMGLAATPNNPIRKLVLNDVGPVINGQALQRIAEYVGQLISFASLAEAQAYIRAISAPFGPHTEAQWQILTEHVVIERDGRWLLHYDPAIAIPFRETAAANPSGHDLTLWPIYDAISCPTLAIRGELSDLLPLAVHAEMAQRGPRATLATIPGVGHAPTLMQAEQIDIVAAFLADPQ
ncbi:alpha/beta fold hydrolase [Parvibium lacunae]|uniref:Alpha/beta hydrolase n=1 Tax=Parvibium lacunae TaxID=1888893 RepID=A0A368L7I3_9BURK|nr:alpha/beta hydrolase [Parvibium lacunae]RCS59658.1 alpha/beta hydrolase [Parvibium lacunae]